MSLIKNNQADRLVKRDFLDLGDLKRQAEEVLAGARAEARRIVERSREEAQELVDAAARRGHDEGREQGLGEGRAEGRREGHREAIEQSTTRIGEIMSAWAEALDRWESDRNSMLLAAREEILEFALAMGSKITHRIIEADPTVVADQVAEALALVVGPSAVAVSVNPEDRPVVESVMGELLEKISQCTHADVRDDPSLSRGGCVVATSKGRIDATVERQIERIVETLLARAPKPQRPPSE
ncbi:MAG: FliH/SctL family protein [Planctomycetota bacterium]|jgi:flagellar assembly protein FliH